MDGQNEVDFSNNNITPLWKRRSAHRGHLHTKNKSRPQSYQSSTGILFTDFPVEDKDTFTLMQPDETINSPDSNSIQRGPLLLTCKSAPNGKVQFPEHRILSSSLSDQPLQILKMVSNNSINFTSSGSIDSASNKSTCTRKASNQASLSPEKEHLVFTSSLGVSPPEIVHLPNNNTTIALALQPSQFPKSLENEPVCLHAPSDIPHLPLQRIPSNRNDQSDRSSVTLSTNSLAALKVGKQQIIPKSLASETRVIGKANGQNSEPNSRVLKVRSMVETLDVPLVASEDDEAEGDVESPGMLKRSLRSTSYRRAVVSGIDFDGIANIKMKSKLSQLGLKAVIEDKEKFSSLGRIKKKMLKGQGTFDGQENAVLYQNYKEKALDIDSDEDVESKEHKSDEKIVIQYKPLRSTWSQLSAVKRNGLSQTISQEERKRQEAIFEVISSEHSYLLSLEILIRMFKNSKELSSTMTKTESHHLFSNIADVCEASKKFFTELEERHRSNIFIDDISDIVEKHTTSTFDPYIKYCTNEVYQQRTLQKLLATNPSFKEVLSRIETQEECRNLPMISFLILPMQRVTRLPLLMDTICQKTQKDLPKHEVCKRALKAVSKLVRLCNEGARKMERTEMMYTINSQLEFKIKPFPLVSSSRWLVKRGELAAFVEDTGLFSKRTSKQQVYFFLFNDVLIITKKKSDESYNVTDYSLRDQLLVEQCDNEEQNSSPVKSSTPMLYSRQSSANHLFRLTVLSNHAGEKIELLLGTETQNERARWITALGQSNDRRTKDRTTLTQVEVIRSYTAKQPDELSLQAADVVLVDQKVQDGWYEGERLRDGERGWFPMECAKEITCQATIDKNMERMGRLLGLETNV
ncbi:rho guanine nucleotide exchange factor 26 isoform X1 [Pantherophis guttatus]|uniref:Rho guanine nucleotide exchange factor 26 isoform X1 n=1 Tax=Pantherophis guttatus TaxID=94885 RepID=A0A6P9DVI7_PANGU|nr:rho guanine nucleotide exchange factor 26 isoform X1 [Pantherophis guttatus]XP_034295068.1 rho guanine nucleotide exchange factor 26 isoform X1 [Pantherophis guttatus]XP_034295069.1 rho guanine nucleotide exchange factor 26 isoform X1 [Pantherophis guttatus]XP_034295070.1 rho guanine nucleotide exchange factor 26 isoform X1 [Pantherophis guttatus]XP_034295071.1 rho guanine nucleotide exchange factor 26 isoform X1 [Pantherophis guttatus]